MVNETAGESYLFIGLVIRLEVRHLVTLLSEQLKLSASVGLSLTLFSKRGGEDPTTWSGSWICTSTAIPRAWYLPFSYAQSSFLHVPARLAPFSIFFC